MGVMRPKFEDVLEYVRNGEVDLHMEERLNTYPHTRRFLRLARFVCKMLQLKAEAKNEDVPAARPRATDRSLLVRASIKPGSEKLGSLSEEAAKFGLPRSNESPLVSQLLERGALNIRSLGTLEVIVLDEQTSLRFTPVETGKQSDVHFKESKVNPKRLVVGSGLPIYIHIPDQPQTIRLPASLPTTDPLPMLVVNKIDKTPADGLELTFMPESGSFFLLETDAKGLVELSLSELPGILRVGVVNPSVLRYTYVLHITLKK